MWWFLIFVTYSQSFRYLDTDLKSRLLQCLWILWHSASTDRKFSGSSVHFKKKRFLQEWQLYYCGQVFHNCLLQGFLHLLLKYSEVVTVKRRYKTWWTTGLIQHCRFYVPMKYEHEDAAVLVVFIFILNFILHCAVFSVLHSCILIMQHIARSWMFWQLGFHIWGGMEASLWLWNRNIL